MRPARIRLLASSVLVISLIVSACTVVEVTPIPAGWLKTFQEGRQPLERGPQAPGAFSYDVEFSKNTGLIYDPSKIEINAEGAYLRELSSGPWKYPADTPSVEYTGGMPFTAIDDWSEIQASGNEGEFRFQLSIDRANWFYWSGQGWIEGVPHFSQASTTSEIKAHITDFHAKVGNGRLYVRAFLFSPEGKKRVGLKAIRILGVRKLDH